MKNLYNETQDSLTEELTSQGFKAFNARQVFEWIYKKDVTDFESMSNLSKSLRTFLNEHYVLPTLTLHQKQTAKDGTKKYLFKLHDTHLIEAVLMKQEYGLS